MEHFTTTIALVGIVIVVASLLSGVLEQVGAPLVGVFLVLGAVLGPSGLNLVDISLSSPALQTLATLGLALVLFSDAVTIEVAEIRAQRALLWRILGPGTLVPAAVTALAAWLLLGVSVPAAALLGAALASTDPVLLRSVLRSRALPETPRVALRLETGMNDVALLPIVVLAMLALRASDPAATVTGRDIGRSVVGLFLLGPVLGALVGSLGIAALARIRGRVGVRRDYESMYALGLAFSGYAAAEAVGGSGFLAAFAAGLMVAAQDVELCDCFLEYGQATAEMLLLLTFVAFGTSLIWTGLAVIDLPTLLFAAVALTARSVVLYPVLRNAGLNEHDRRLIALFGPRGLSSLLLVLLPVFAGLPGAERLFTVTCLVVLLSVVLHGGGISIFLRSSARRAARAGATPAGAPAAAAPALVEPAPVSPTVEAPAAAVQTPVVPRPAADASERIGIAEVQELRSRGESVIMVDARADRSYRADGIQVAGAVRVPPDDAVRSATALRLSHHATLVVYCA